MASSAKSPPVYLSTVILLAGLLLPGTCLTQIAPAPSPLQTQLASIPVFAGQRPNTTVNAVVQNAILTARPSFSALPTQLAGAPRGLLKLGLNSSSRDGYLYVPSTYHVQRPSPFIVSLHAAGRNGLDSLGPLITYAESYGAILLAPDSRAATWDYLNTATFGPDVAFINASMGAVFAKYRVDPTTLGIEGFSDGATYALILGITNGGVFERVIGFSPGGILSPGPTGKPSFFLAAGNDDETYGEPANRVAASIACQLQLQGYSVDFREFQGGHVVDSATAMSAMSWFEAPPLNDTLLDFSCS